MSRADNFYESTFPNWKRRRQAAMLEKNVAKRRMIDDTFNQLMRLGFQRRNFRDSVDSNGDNPNMSIVLAAAKKTEEMFELSKSKEQQLDELKRRQLKTRSSIMKLVPQGLHKYVDYLQSLRIKPKPSELTRNLGLGAFFSFIVQCQPTARHAIMYLIVGQLIMVSALLTRNSPQYKVVPGMERRKPATWSSNSFKTAVAIALSSAGTAFVLVRLMCNLIPMPAALRGKLATIASIMSSAYITTFFEVFEEKNKNGWRWNKALKGSLPGEVEASLSAQVFSDKAMVDTYDFQYDPQIDDFPPAPKFVDDLPENQVIANGEIDEVEAKQHFDGWMAVRREARKPPVTEAPPETPWVGGKAGMYVKNIPTWLSNAYNNKVLNANKWRNKTAKYAKDYTEFQPIEGPFGFRDKRPEWLDMFGTGVWEDKVQSSRRVARAFGTYRKTMYKIDKHVVLQPCDGADKNDRKKDEEGDN